MKNSQPAIRKHRFVHYMTHFTIPSMMKTFYDSSQRTKWWCSWWIAVTEWTFSVTEGSLGNFLRTHESQGRQPPLCQLLDCVSITNIIMTTSQLFLDFICFVISDWFGTRLTWKIHLSLTSKNGYSWSGGWWEYRFHVKLREVVWGRITNWTVWLTTFPPSLKGDHTSSHWIRIAQEYYLYSSCIRLNKFYYFINP